MRPIGDPDWMSAMNYARHYEMNADFPTAWGRGSYMLWNTSLSSSMLAGKTHSIVYIASNCLTQSHRDDFVVRASRFFDIDSQGECERNKDTQLRLQSIERGSDGLSVRTKWDKRMYTGAAALLAPYRFRMLIVSSLCNDYFSEKIAQTLKAGVIPLYLGMPNSHSWDPGLAA